MAWGKTIYGQFELLAGKSAPHGVLQLLTYKSLTFSEEIERIDTVRAYHVSFLLRLVRFLVCTHRFGIFQSGPVRQLFCQDSESVIY